MRNYQHMSYVERQDLFMGLETGLSLRAIGRHLGRSHSTVVREVRRNRLGTPLYLPDRAEQQYHDRRRACKGLKLGKDERLRRVVWAKLKQGWSPEQIAGRLKREGSEHQVSHETIYRFVYSEGGMKRELCRLLPSRKQRRGGRAHRHKTGTIPFMVSVHERPESARERKLIGHWEADLLCFRRSYNEAVTTLVERASRYTALVLNPCKFTSTVMRGIKQRIKDLPQGSVGSMTFDQGREFNRHTLLHRSGIKTYFCDAGKPWQKGSVENTNKRLRRFLPKSLDAHTITPHQIGLIARKLNNTPRKCLGYATPNEAFFQINNLCGALQT